MLTPAAATRPTLLHYLAALGLGLLWWTLPLPAELPASAPGSSSPAAQPAPAAQVEVQTPIYRTVFLRCSFRQRDGFQLLKSSNILEFVRHIWKSDTKNTLILKISSLETVLPFLHDGYLPFYSLSFGISCSLLKSLFEISHSRGLPKVCSILQMVAHFLWPPDNAFCHSYCCEMPSLPFLFFSPCDKFCKDILVLEKRTQNMQLSSSFYSDYVFLKYSNTRIPKYFITQDPVSL